MGPFDKGVKKEAFETFKAEVFKELQGQRDALAAANVANAESAAALRAEIAAKTPESEQAVHEAAARAQISLEKLNEHAASVEDWLAEVDETKHALDATLAEIRERQSSIGEIAVSLKGLKSSSEAILAQIQKDADQALASANTIAAQSESLKGEVERAKALPALVAEVNDFHEKSSQDSKNIQALLAHAMKRKAEIDELHKEVMGYDIKDAEGKVERIDGVKDTLSHAYDQISSRADGLGKEIADLIDSLEKEHIAHSAQQQAQFKELLIQSEGKVKKVSDELTSLLPGALAEGLSAAYENKKNDETVSLRKFESSFSKTIWVMLGIATIPFWVDAYLLVEKNRDLVDVIKETPRLIAAIIPLYLPMLWLAYSTNKKINLAKRLIEEYTHKAVLGKTFSGLANQIESLPKDGSMREELRAKLLLNLLDVSAENPGKLISDYNKADHPLMDALENSTKLSKSVDVLSKIPGMSAIAKFIESRSEKMLATQATSVANGLADQGGLESASKSAVDALKAS